PPELRARLYEAEWSVRFRADDVIGSLAYAELLLLAYQRLYGEDSAEYGRALAALAVSLHNIGALREAEVAYLQAALLIERSLGPSHPSALLNRRYLGDAQLELGEVEAARATLEHALSLQPTREEPNAAKTMVTLALVYDAVGRFDDAMELARQALEHDRRVRRPDHPDLSYYRRLPGQFALDRHDLAEAAPRCDEALALRLGNRFPNPYDIADTYALEADLARRKRDFAKARSHIEQALAVHRRLGPW